MDNVVVINVYTPMGESAPSGTLIVLGSTKEQVLDILGGYANYTGGHKAMATHLKDSGLQVIIPPAIAYGPFDGACVEQEA